MRKYIIIGLVIVLGTLTSCSLEPTLADESDTNITTVQTMRQLMNASYSTMTDYRYMGRNYIIAGEVRADNVYSNGHSGRFTDFSSMNLIADDAEVRDLFRYMYTAISYPNIIINSNIDEIQGNEADKLHILGEAYAARAMVHFDLLRLYGQQYINGGNNLGISYVTEFKGDEVQIPRGTVEENKTKIYNDLQTAIDYLTQGANSQYAHNKTNLTLDAAYALITRVGTYFKDYDKVRDAAQAIIGNYSVTPASEYVNYWSMLSPGQASIFELAQSATDNNGSDCIAYIYRGDAYGDIQCYDNLIADAGFDSTDVRASSAMIAVDANGALRNMGKYPHMGTELGIDNIKMIRYAEVVLNYAEALLGTNPGMALTMLNKIPNNRNAQPYTVANMENILKERRKELMFEGFRFFDLARSGQDIPEVDPTTPNNHGLVPAGNNKFALPIPQRELDANPEAVQNPGY